jgi:hypothetical protein
MAGPAITNLVTTALRGGTIRSRFTPVVADATILAASDGTTNELIPAKTGHTLFITLIVFAVTTDAAQTITLQDDANTPVVIAKCKASPGIGPIEWNFGEDGTPLTEAKALDLNISAAGLAGRLHVEGYYRLTAVGA